MPTYTMHAQAQHECIAKKESCGKFRRIFPSRNVTIEPYHGGIGYVDSEDDQRLHIDEANENLKNRPEKIAELAIDVPGKEQRSDHSLLHSYMHGGPP